MNKKKQVPLGNSLKAFNPRQAKRMTRSPREFWLDDRATLLLLAGVLLFWGVEGPSSSARCWLIPLLAVALLGWPRPAWTAGTHWSQGKCEALTAAVQSGPLFTLLMELLSHLFCESSLLFLPGNIFCKTFPQKWDPCFFSGGSIYHVIINWPFANVHVWTLRDCSFSSIYPYNKPVTKLVG